MICPVALVTACSQGIPCFIVLPSYLSSLLCFSCSQEVVKLVVAMSQLGIKSKAVGSALDAVAGHIVKRLKTRHVSAVARPSM